MKKNYALVLLVLTLSYSKIKAQNNPELELLQLNLINLLNKPIDSLLSKLPQLNDTTMSIGPGNTMFQGASLYVSYPGKNYWLYLRPHDIQFITVLNNNRLPPYLAWPFNLLRKEKLGTIIIYKGEEILRELNYTPGTEYKKK